jgi:hypothetical protein
MAGVVAFEILTLLFNRSVRVVSPQATHAHTAGQNAS